MLYIKIDIEKNKENLQAVMAALAEFDIISASWEEPGAVDVSVDPKLRAANKGGDLSAQVSAALDQAHRRRGNG